MISFLKNLVGICIFFLFLFFCYSTFFISSNSSISKLNYEKTLTGYYVLSLDQSGQLLKEKFDITTKNKEGDYFLDQISEFDKIYFSNFSSYKKNNLGKDNIIEFGNSRIFSDINYLDINYEFRNDLYYIKPTSIGKFYIDSTNPLRIKIFSISGILEIGYKSKEGILLNKSYIFPHEYIIFNPNKNLLIKDSDLLRVDQVFNISYIPGKINDKIISDNISSFIGPLGNSFLEISFKDLFLDTRFVLENYKLLNSLEVYNFFDINNLFFVNDSKKLIIYKNILLENINKLFKSKEVNDNLINEIISYLNKVLSINKDDKIYFIGLINHYYKTISYNSDLKNINQLINFNNLISKLNNVEKKQSLNSFIFLRNIFNSYEKDNIDNDIITFSNMYIEENKNLDNDNNLIGDYFIFYLKNYISSNLIYSDSLNPTIVNKLLNLSLNYINFSKKLYFSENDLILTTGLHQLLLFYNDLDIFFNSYFFEKDRTDRGLLIRKDTNGIDYKIISLLEKNTFDIFEIFDKNKTLLKNPKLYENINLNFKQYFLSIIDYDSYLINYDKIKSNFLNTKTIIDLEDKKIAIFDENYIIEYLSKFNGINISTLKYELVDSYYYNIKSIDIGGNIFSFYLYPYEGNVIEKIIINNDNSKFYNKSFNLKKYALFTGESSDNFKNFFINTFSTKNADSIDVFNTKITNDNEDKFIKSFKRDKLFSDKGEFSVLSGFLNILYDEVKVVFNQNNYDINIIDSFFSVGEGDLKYYGFISSKYIIDNNNHNFSDIKIKISKEDLKNGGILMFSGKYINIIGDIYILDLEKKLNLMINSINSLFLAYSSINSKFETNDIKIDYIISTGNYKLSLENVGKKFEIEINGDIIKKLNYNLRNINSVLNTNISNLDSIIDSLNK